MTARPDYLRQHSSEQQAINLAGLRGMMRALGGIEPVVPLPDATGEPPDLRARPDPHIIDLALPQR